MHLLRILERAWFGNSLTQWLIALATLGGVYVALAVTQRVFVRRLGALAAKTETDWDDLLVETVQRTRAYFIFIIALRAATFLIVLPGRWSVALRALSVVLVLLQTGVWGNGFIGFFADHYIKSRGSADAGTRATINALGYGGRFVLWVLLVITALQIFDINVTALITGLGVGGIAIALAVQNILGDLFAALSIVLDKPFVVGDSVQVDAVSGTIEHIGLKTTRIRSVSGEQVIISNADLLRSRIRNYKRMEHRRVAFTLDLAFETSPAKLADVPATIRQVIESHANTRFDRAHLLTIGETGLRFEIVYYVLDPDYNRYADVQHAINLELLRRFKRERIDFGFATRTMQLTTHPEPTPT